MMSEEQYRFLLNEFVQARSKAELKTAIERNLTKLDIDFERWLAQRSNELSEVDPNKAARLEDAGVLIKILVEQGYGDYRRARFNESCPANLKETLLALARRVERNELDLNDAVVQGVLALSGYLRNDPFTSHADWHELYQSISVAQDRAAYAILADLMYQIAQPVKASVLVLPILLHEAVSVLILSRSAEALKLVDQNQHQAALQIYNRLLTIAQDNNELDDQVRLLLTIGDIYQLKLEPPEYSDHLILAEKYYRQAHQVTDQINLTPLARADISFNLGRTIVKQDRIEEGVDWLKECLSLSPALGLDDENLIYYCQAELARAYKGLENYQAVSTYLRKAAAQAPNVKERIKLLAQLVNVLAVLGDAGTHEVLEEMLQIIEDEPDLTSMYDVRKSVYFAQASYLQRIGDIQGAMDAFAYAKQAAEKIGDQMNEARLWANLGQNYWLLGEQENAELAFKRAGEVHLQLDDTLALANLYYNWGGFKVATGDLIEGAKLLASAYVLYHQEHESGRMGGAASLLGRVYREMGDLQKARACVDYSLSKAEALGDLHLKCGALIDLAFLQARENKATEAVETYAKAIALAQQIGSRMVEQAARLKRGILLEQQGLTEEAVDDYRRAVTLLETTRSHLRTVERRIWVQKESVTPYTRLVLLLSRQADTPDAVCEAFDFAERARSRTLVELLSYGRFYHPVSLPQILAQREEDLMVKLRYLTESDELGIELEQECTRSEEELEEVWRQIAAIDKVCSDYVSLRQSLIDFKFKEVTELLEPG